MISVPRWPYLEERPGKGPENISDAMLGGDQAGRLPVRGPAGLPPVGDGGGP